MPNRYKDDDSLEWELMTDMIIDLTDGYLSSVQGIEYQNASGANSTPLETLNDDKEYVEGDVLGSRLLKTLSNIHSVAIQHTIRGKPKDETLYRLSKFVPVATKLSDEYAMEDRIYEKNWHDDVLSICEAIREVE